MALLVAMAAIQLASLLIKKFFERKDK